MWMENGSSENKTDLTKFQMTKIAYSMTSHFFSQLLFYIYHFTSFRYSRDTQPQACSISLVYKNMTVRRHQNCVLFPETGKD